MIWWQTLVNRAAKCVFAISILSLLGGCEAGLGHAEHGYPRKPIKLVVPFAAGGGSDTFARTIQHAIEKHALLPQPIVIVNVPGAGGTIGSRRVKQARPDGYTILLLHDGMMTAKYSGAATYGAAAFTPIAGTGNASQVIAVSESSPLRSLSDLMQAIVDRPDRVVFSANIGAPSHFAGLMLESTVDQGSFRYTQNGGGAKRFAALQGDHVDVSSFSIAEYKQFRPSGLRALAILSKTRHPDLADLPTALEQGFDVVSANTQFWWAPLGTPQDRISTMSEAVTRAMQTPDVQQRLREMSISNVTFLGDELQNEIDSRRLRIAQAAPSSKPATFDFANLTLCGFVVSGVIALVRSSRRSAVFHRTEQPRQNRSDVDRRKTYYSLSIAVVTALYVAVMQVGLVSFVVATFLFTILTAYLVRTNDSTDLDSSDAVVGRWVSIIAMSVAMSVVLHFVFSNILVVDLP